MVAYAGHPAEADQWWERLPDPERERYRKVARMVLAAVLPVLRAHIADPVLKLHAKHVEEGWIDRCAHDELIWPCPTVEALLGSG